MYIYTGIGGYNKRQESNTVIASKPSHAKRPGDRQERERRNTAAAIHTPNEPPTTPNSRRNASHNCTVLQRGSVATSHLFTISGAFARFCEISKAPQKPPSAQPRPLNSSHLCNND